jgi:DNA-binding NtrC family response regulator
VRRSPATVDTAPVETTLRLGPAPSPPALVLAHPGGREPLSPGRPLVLGSAAAAGLRVDDRYVSARHAVILGERGRLVVEDMGSTNGTWVDGVRVQRAWLAAGTRLQLGGWRAAVLADVADVAAAPDMVGASPAFAALQRQLTRLAGFALPALVRGETGTGKELAARALHDRGPRARGPFVAVNCGAIPDGLCESELFGHVRGAFTGAHRDRAGAFARAHAGTLFLDEIAELPLALQAKLLRVLETRRILPVGGEDELAVDVRVVAATHQPLEALVAAGRFREDLLHRLGVLHVDLPPLAERRDDIPALLAHFAATLAPELGRPIDLRPEAVAAARAHDWPGNVRELRNALLRAAAVADGPIGPADLLPRAALRPAAADTIAVPRGTWTEMQRALLRRVVADAGSIRRAAAALDVPRSTLANWLA